MREVRKEGKSHNVGKSGKSTGRQGNAVCRKRITAEERSAQVDREIGIIVMLVIGIVIAIASIAVFRSKAGGKENDEQTDRCENGEYIGEREIDIKELSNVEEKEEKLPESDLYEETKDMDEQGRFKHYKDAVESIIYPENMRSSSVIEEKSEEDIEQWNDLYVIIDAKESKKGDAEDVKELTILSSKEYRDIYILCYKAYRILPQGDMATRYGRNAGDALKTGFEEGDSYSQLVTDFNFSNEGYVTSFHYRDCSQKLADGCYWAGNNFYQFLYNYPGLEDRDKEHCVLMAYCYSFFGYKASGEEGVQHRNDLKQIEEETRRRLIEEYNYPEDLFSNDEPDQNNF